MSERARALWRTRCASLRRACSGIESAALLTLLMRLKTAHRSKTVSRGRLAEELRQPVRALLETAVVEPVPPAIATPDLVSTKI